MTAIRNTPSKVPQVFQWQYVEAALRDICDVQERVLIEFILLGDTANAIRQQKPLETDSIELCVSSTQITPEVASNFKTWNFIPMMKVDETGVRPISYSWTYSPPTLWDIKVPITLYVYKKNYALFDNPSRSFASTESFLLPNPFEKYWLGRHLILGKLKKGTL